MICTCRDCASRPQSPGQTGLNDTMFNLHCFAGFLFAFAMLSLEGQFNKDKHFSKKDRVRVSVISKLEVYGSFYFLHAKQYLPHRNCRRSKRNHLYRLPVPKQVFKNDNSLSLHQRPRFPFVSGTIDQPLLLSSSSWLLCLAWYFLDQFLHMVLGRSLISFFCLRIFRFPSPAC